MHGVGQDIADLGMRFWAWRAHQQPRSRDDIPRLDRPDGWRPAWTAEDVAGYRATRDGFAEELRALRPGSEPADVVDHRLLRSAVARVTWELDVLRSWQTQPRFYTDQALGPVFDVLLRPGVDADRVGAVVDLLRAVPGTLAVGRSNLDGVAVTDFTRTAIEELPGIEARLGAVGAALEPLAGPWRAHLPGAVRAAADAFAAHRDWLTELLPGTVERLPVGREGFGWFLTEVACIPMTPDQLLMIGKLELDRAMTWERVRRQSPTVEARGQLPSDAVTQCSEEAGAELAVREFYEQRGLLGQPAGLRHYLNLPMPEYLAPLAFLGVSDDLTGPNRLNEDGVSYVPDPVEDLPYFYDLNARDVRVGIVHEGVHYQQLALSFAHPRPVRRHYYDSGANEGLAFYNEELMLTAGLFDDRPDTRADILNMMRLRALRVEVDVRLGLGELDVDAAAEYLQREVPMDRETAREEAAFFAESPGQAMTYQIGKTQILALIADIVRDRGDGFDLRAVHDHLWRNGNVPIALTRWELLGRTDELAAIGVTASG